MTEVRPRRPQQWEDEVERIFELLEAHGEPAVRDALIEVARRGVVGAEFVERGLQRTRQDSQSTPPP